MDYKTLKEDLDKSLVNSNILLSGAKVLTKSSCDSPEYGDKKYLPFFYHFGKQLNEVEKVIQIGPKLGLVAACFLQSCSVVEWTIIGENNRTTLSNTKLKSPKTSVCFSLCKDVKNIKFDLVMITENYKKEFVAKNLMFLWDRLDSGGLLVCDYIDSDAQGKAFREFCRVKNREPIEIKTRYGVGIIEK